jgi:hypothetical protein
MKPELSEKAHAELKEFIERTKKSICDKLRDEIGAIESTCYTDYGLHLDSDTWMNYREKLRHALQGGFYKEVLNSEEGRWARSVRDFIFLEHREELEKCLSADLVKKIEELNAEIERLNKRVYGCWPSRSSLETRIY